MALITIRDTLNVEILSANPQVSSGFGKYLKGTSANLLAGVDVATQFRGPLHLAHPGESGLGLSWADTVPLANGAGALSIAAGAHAVVGVYNRRGMDLVENTFIGEPLKVELGQGYVAFSIRPNLEVGVKRQVGALSFGFSAGTEMELRCYRPFDLTGPTITVAEACKDLLENFVIPNSADDLKKMKGLPAGTLACASGHGQLQISASVDLAAAFNPLASVDALGKLGKLDVSAGASASVGVSAFVSGDFQIRVQKTDDAFVRLSYHKVAGRGVDVTLTGSAGVGVTLGDKDLLSMLFKGPGGVPGAGVEDLVAAGITRAQLDRVTDAMTAGLSRKLEVAVGAQFSALKQDEAAFLYEIDLDALDQAGSAAVDRALSGDLTALNDLEPALPGHGIRMLLSRTELLRVKSISWQINLVGLINVLSMTELVRTGTIVHDEESGELVITDKVTKDRVGAITTPKQIRKLLYESTMMTLTYRASGLDVNTDLAASQSFFFFDKDANRQRVSDYLDAVAAVGLMNPIDIERKLGNEDDFGKASLQLQTRFDKLACERMFNQPGPPFDQTFYENVGRRALLALVKDSDPDAYRRRPLKDDGLWKAMKDAGQPNFPFILPPPITGDSSREGLRVAVVAADYTVIVWWAKAMATAANRLADMQAFLNGRQATALDTDPDFRKRRADLESAIVKVIRQNTSTFDDPWGLVALFMASAGTAKASAMVISPKFRFPESV
jgi:hypothetical protein